jgi:hypothetical protein
MNIIENNVVIESEVDEYLKLHTESGTLEKDLEGFAFFREKFFKALKEQGFQVTKFSENLPTLTKDGVVMTITMDVILV